MFILKVYTRSSLTNCVLYVDRVRLLASWHDYLVQTLGLFNLSYDGCEFLFNKLRLLSMTTGHNWERDYINCKNCCWGSSSGAGG